MRILKLVVSLCLLLFAFNPLIGDDKLAKQDKVEKIAKMEDIKQEILGVNKEFKRGQLIKLKVSPLPVSDNPITAAYKFTLLENGKKSEDLEILTKSQKNSDPVKDGSDIIFTARCDFNGKYQLIFAATYIETKSGTAEIVRVYNPDVLVYDIKISGQVPDNPVNPDIPSGTFGMIKAIYDESRRMDIPKEFKVILFDKLANVFSGMSSKIAAGIFKNSDDEKEQADRINTFLKQAKEENNKAIEESKVDKSKFDGHIDIIVQKKLNELFDAGKMRKFEEYQAFWAEIAEGFRLAKKGLE